jgi:hypothetical protein
MTSRWEAIIDRNRLYSIKELGGCKYGETEDDRRGILSMSYDSVRRKIVDDPRYASDITGDWNARRTYRSNIQIPGWVVIDWLERHTLAEAA